MTACTEVARIPLKPGIDALNPSTDEGKAMQEILDTVLAQPGCQRAYYGMEIENPSQLAVIVDWDDISKHKEFMQAPAYGPFLKRFEPLMAGGLSMMHANMQPHNAPGTFANGKATEFLSADFPATLSDADKQTIDAEYKEVLAIMVAEKGGPSGWTSGFTLETDLPGEKDAAHRGIKRFTALGWDSVEQHHQFRETAAFKTHINRLRELPHLAGLGVFHSILQVQQARGL